MQTTTQGAANEKTDCGAQLSLTFADPRLDPADKPRLSAQCRLILDLLRQGPVTNRQLADIALKYTSRISDLRKSGYSVQVTERDHVSGLVWYELTNCASMPKDRT